jgi:hypothetical protein
MRFVGDTERFLVALKVMRHREQKFKCHIIKILLLDPHMLDTEVLASLATCPVPLSQASFTTHAIAPAILGNHCATVGAWMHHDTCRTKLCECSSIICAVFMLTGAATVHTPTKLTHGTRNEASPGSKAVATIASSARRGERCMQGQEMLRRLAKDTSKAGFECIAVLAAHQVAHALAGAR